MAKAHNLEAKERTNDIVLSVNESFDDLNLSEWLLKGLNDSGFVKPSPIQVNAIPCGLCGLDLIVQSKAGTGKTCVFAVIALEGLSVKSTALQVLVLSPTREISIQSQRVISSLGKHLNKFKCSMFIGGVHYKKDVTNLVKCQIAVGTPGRITYLMKSGYMKTNSVRLLVLDEADMLLTDNFQPTINWIYSALPHSKQIIALSATYTESMAQRLTLYMKNPTFVRLNALDPTLIGIRQYFTTVSYSHMPNIVFDRKLQVLIQILTELDFSQCLVFSNLQERAQLLCQSLTQKGWLVSYISGSLDQAQRTLAYDRLREFNCRILVSTDLVARGIDAENVNVVVNLDIPDSHETYMHRIGRAGRYGSYGCAISLASEGRELEQLLKYETMGNMKIARLPDPVHKDLATPSVNIATSGIADYISKEQLDTSDKIEERNQLLTSGKLANIGNYMMPAEAEGTQQKKKNKTKKPTDGLTGVQSRDDPEFTGQMARYKAPKENTNDEGKSENSRGRQPFVYDDLFDFPRGGAAIVMSSMDAEVEKMRAQLLGKPNKSVALNVANGENMDSSCYKSHVDNEKSSTGSDVVGLLSGDEDSEIDDLDSDSDAKVIDRDDTHNNGAVVTFHSGTQTEEAVDGKMSRNGAVVTFEQPIELKLNAGDEIDNANDEIVDELLLLDEEIATASSTVNYHYNEYMRIWHLLQNLYSQSI